MASEQPAVIEDFIPAGSYFDTISNVDAFLERHGEEGSEARPDYTGTIFRLLTGWLQGVRVERLPRSEQWTFAQYVERAKSDPSNRYTMLEWAPSEQLFSKLPLPPVLEELGFKKLYAGATTSAGIWDPELVATRLFLSKSGDHSDLHADWDGQHVLNYQIFGKKRWIMLPPEAGHKVGAVDLWGTVRPHRMPPEELGAFLEYTGGCEVTLNPREAVYVPPYWYHSVSYPELALGVAYRYAPPPRDVVPLIVKLHSSPALLTLYVARIRNPQDAGHESALAELSEIADRKYSSLWKKFWAVENYAESYVRERGLFGGEDAWGLRPRRVMGPWFAYSHYTKHPPPGSSRAGQAWWRFKSAVQFTTAARLRRFAGMVGPE